MIFVYRISSPRLGKPYIGFTSDPPVRLARHLSTARNQPLKPGSLHWDMKQYGMYEFEMELLACCKTISDARWIESFLIGQEGALRPFGYNQNGGMACRIAKEKDQ